MSYALNKPLTLATAVDCCVPVRLRKSTELDLVTTGGNVLRVFRVAHTNPRKSSDGKALELILSVELFDVVDAMVSYPIIGRRREGLLLAFRNAKVSQESCDCRAEAPPNPAA